MKNFENKYSVIVPIYNVDNNKLKKCVESIIRQTYRNIEIILVDDGSNNDNFRICEEFKKTDDRIKVIHQKNMGLSGARNSGVKVASGEYYTFVDSDDFLDDDAIERLNIEINKDDEIEVISSRLKPASKKEDIGKFPYEDKKIYSSDEEREYIIRMLMNFYGNNNSSCGKMYKKSFTDKYNLFHNEELKQGAEDLEFNYRVFCNAKKIEILVTPFYNCVYNNNSITRSFNENNIYLTLKCFNTIEREIKYYQQEYLYEIFYTRISFASISALISGFFNPSNKLKYLEQKKLAKKYLNNELVKKSLKQLDYKSLDKKRKIIIVLIRLKLFRIISVLARLRYNQKKNEEKK